MARSLSTRQFLPSKFTKRAGQHPALLNLLKIALFALFFAYIFVYFGKIKIWDLDFFWHLGTGKYIVEHRGLPDSDPFSYTAALAASYDPVPEREPFILKMYWLSQVLFYFVNRNFGFGGISALRAALLTLTAITVFIGLRRKGVSFPISYFFTLLIFLIEQGFTGERPQLFSFFFTALTVLLLEEARSGRAKYLYFLPFITLIWANMHGGFIIGDCLMAVYMAFEGAKRRSGSKRLLIAGSAAILLSLINPNGYRAFTQVLVVDKYFGSVQELMPPFHFFSQGLWAVNYAYIAMLAFALVALVYLGKKDPMASVLIAATAFFGIKSWRYTIFFSVIGAFFIAPQIDVLYRKIAARLASNKIFRAFGRYKVFECSAALVLICLLAVEVSSGILADEINIKSLPVEAAEFIKRENLPGRMFNGDAFGGYFIWELYPDKQVFTDTRALKVGVWQDYGMVMNAVKEIKGRDLGLKPGEALWENTLDAYNVNYVVTPIIDLRGEIYPLPMALMENPRWALIYSDPVASIFIRNTEPNRHIIAMHAKTADSLYNSVIHLASYLALKNKTNPAYMVTLGRAFEKTGRPEEAKKAYGFALQKDPGNIEAMAGLKRGR